MSQRVVDFPDPASPSHRRAEPEAAGARRPLLARLFDENADEVSALALDGRARLRRALLLAALAGALSALCWLPLGIAALHPFLLVPLAPALLEATSARRALAIGAAFMVARFAVGAHFVLLLLEYSWLALPLYLLAVFVQVPYGLIAALGAYGLRRAAGVPPMLGFGGIYVLMEWLRSVGDLAFPADLIGHGLGSDPSFLALNAWLGPYGPAALSFVVAWLLWRALSAKSFALAPRAALAAAGVALWVLPPIADAFAAGPAAEGPVLRVGIVQPYARVEEKLDPSRRPALGRRLASMSRRLAAQQPDLIVWPESARPGPIIWDESRPFDDPEIRALAEELGTPILYGAELARVRGRQVQALYNAAVLVPADGAPASWYGKQHLLPFVEGVPFAEELGFDPAERARRQKRGALTLFGNFAPGPAPNLLEIGPARLGVMICYEGFFPQLARHFRREGANALVVLTNDAWWGKSLFPLWHARMAATRARETGLPVLRAANSGVSSMTDADGTLLAETELGEQATRLVTLRLGSSPPTFYARHGELLVPAIALGLAAAGLGGALRRRRRPTDAAPAGTRPAGQAAGAGGRALR